MQWVEKYRPKKLQDFALDEVTLQILRNFTDKNGKDITNILLNGNSGIGKTSLSHYIACVLGCPFREYNASDLRGISTIDDILAFHVNTDKSKKKVIILDEADNITRKAQELIVNLMDTYTETLVFIFTSNNISNFISSIIDRVICVHITHDKHMQIILDRIKFIVESENLICDNKTICKMIIDSGYDIRACINKLEMLSKCCNKITPKHTDIINTSSPIWDIVCLFNHMCVANNFQSVNDQYNLFVRKGLSSSDFVVMGIEILTLHTTFKEYKMLDNISPSQCIELLKILHLFNFKTLSLCFASEMQTIDLLYSLYEAIKLKCM